MSRIADHDAVQAVMEAYIGATRDGDRAAMAALFHPDAMLAGWLGDTLRDGSPAPFLDRVGALKADPGYAARITAIDVIGRSATATLIEEDLWGADFVNRFHLLQQADGSWTITAKLFHCDTRKD